MEEAALPSCITLEQARALVQRQSITGRQCGMTNAFNE